MAKIYQLTDSQTNEEIYPITLTDCVYDSDNRNINQIVNDYYSEFDNITNHAISDFTKSISDKIEEPLSIDQDVKDELNDRLAGLTTMLVDPNPTIKYITANGKRIQKTGLEDWIISHEKIGNNCWLITLDKNIEEFSKDTLYINHYEENSDIFKTTITSIELQNFNNLKRIGNQFLYNTIIESIIIGDMPNLEDIGTAFAIATSNTPTLKYIKFGKLPKLSNINTWFIRNQNKLKEIDLSFLSTAKTIGTYFLNNCTSLTNIKFPDLQITTLNTILTNCTNLETIEFGDMNELETFPTEFLKTCTSLKHIKFGSLNSLKNMPDNFLSDMPSLETVEFTSFKSLETVGNNFLADCPKLTTITGNLFSYCPKLTSIGSYMLANCLNLSEIPQNSFAYCPNLTNIGTHFLYNNAGLDELPNYFMRYTYPTEIDRYFLAYTSLTKYNPIHLQKLTYLPDSFLYRNSNITSINFSSWENIVEDKGNFLGVSHIETMDWTFCNKLTKLGNYFMYNWQYLKEDIDFSPFTNVESIGNRSFWNVSCNTINLWPMTSLKSIGERAFWYASQKSIILPDNLEKIGENMFGSINDDTTSPNDNSVTYFQTPILNSNIDIRVFLKKEMTIFLSSYTTDLVEFDYLQEVITQCTAFGTNLKIYVWDVLFDTYKEYFNTFTGFYCYEHDNQHLNKTYHNTYLGTLNYDNNNYGYYLIYSITYNYDRTLSISLDFNWEGAEPPVSIGEPKIFVGARRFPYTNTRQYGVNTSQPISIEYENNIIVIPIDYTTGIEKEYQAPNIWTIYMQDYYNILNSDTPCLYIYCNNNGNYGLEYADITWGWPGNKMKLIDPDTRTYAYQYIVPDHIEQNMPNITNDIGYIFNGNNNGKQTKNIAWTDCPLDQGYTYYITDAVMAAESDEPKYFVGLMEISEYPDWLQQIIEESKKRNNIN